MHLKLHLHSSRLNAARLLFMGSTADQDASSHQAIQVVHCTCVVAKQEAPNGSYHGQHDHASMWYRRSGWQQG